MWVVAGRPVPSDAVVAAMSCLPQVRAVRMSLSLLSVPPVSLGPGEGEQGVGAPVFRFPAGCRFRAGASGLHCVPENGRPPAHLKGPHVRSALPASGTSLISS